MALLFSPADQTDQMRHRVVEWLCRQPDDQLRSAVFALQLIHDPRHLVTLFGMAARSIY